MYKITIKVEEVDTTPTREEILEVIKTEFQIAAYQAETYLMWRRGLLAREEMIKMCTRVLLDQSEENTIMFSEWLDDQTGNNYNNLPIRSSGSTFTQLTDYDNILSSYDEELDSTIWEDIQDNIDEIYYDIVYPVRVKGYNEFKEK